MLKEHIVQIEGVLELLFSPVEDNQVKELNKALLPMKSVTLALQRNEMDMVSARLLFDELLRQTKELDVKRKYIPQNCEIASNKDFENGTVKILNGEENALTVGEQLACRKLRKTNVQDIEEIEDEDFASQVLAKRQKQAPKLKYISCKFLLPTSNILARFFSSAGYAFDELGQNLTPYKLELQLFLKFNKRFWDLSVVNDIVNDTE